MTALPFTARFFASDVTHFSVSSNGFMQLWPSSAGTPLSSATNAAIPTAGFVGVLTFDPVEFIPGSAGGAAADEIAVVAAVDAGIRRQHGVGRQVT